jgi:hypothetical protein
MVKIPDHGDPLIRSFAEPDGTHLRQLNNSILLLALLFLLTATKPSADRKDGGLENLGEDMIMKSGIFLDK